MKYYHTKTKYPKSFSLLIIPHEKDIKQVKIANWIPKFLLALMILTISIISFFTYNLHSSYTNLRIDYSAKVDKLSDLEKINMQQKNEIDNLKMKTAEIEEKLQAITILQETVKEMVGLDEVTEGNSDADSNTIASRGGAIVSRASLIEPQSSYNIDEQIDDLLGMLDKSSDELSNLINDVEQRLDYLDAKPNLMPATGKISSKYGYRKNPFGSGREFHTGIDIANNSGTKIKAAGSGVVTFAGYNGGYGRVIMISHGYGYQSIYGHNRKLLVKVGDKVEKGQVIAEMGSTGRSTGPHVHFEIRYYGKPKDPLTVINSNE